MRVNNATEPIKQLARFLSFWTIILVAAVALTVGTWAPAVLAYDDEDEVEIPFDEAVIYFELNDTDEDLGIHALIDGDAWKYLEIEDPRGRRILNVFVRGRLARQGLTEFFFESAEPNFDDLAPEKFFRRFPEGEYEIEGITLEGDELESEVSLSHVMPAPPVVYVNGTKADWDCAEDDPPAFAVSEPIVISWDAVTENHPDLGKSGDIEVHNYEVVVEIDDTPWKTSAILSPELDVLAFEVPPEILSLAEFEGGVAEIKFEVLVRAINHNQTAVESCLLIAEQED